MLQQYPFYWREVLAFDLGGGNQEALKLQFSINYLKTCEFNRTWLLNLRL